MRYSLLMIQPEAGQAGVSQEAITEAMKAFDLYAKALNDAGVLVSAEVPQPTTASTTVTLRNGALQVQDGPFADTKEQLGGVFVIDVPDLDAALAWAEKNPAAQWGSIEIRPTAVYSTDGTWHQAE